MNVKLGVLFLILAKAVFAGGVHTKPASSNTETDVKAALSGIRSPTDSRVSHCNPSCLQATHASNSEPKKRAQDSDDQIVERMVIRDIGICDPSTSVLSLSDKFLGANLERDWLNRKTTADPVAWTLSLRAKASIMLKHLYFEVLQASQPRPKLSKIVYELGKVAPLPKELREIVGEYAQSLVPLGNVLMSVTNETSRWYNDHWPLEALTIGYIWDFVVYNLKSAETGQLDVLLQQQGIAFPHSRVVLEEWEQHGFKRLARAFFDDRMICEECTQNSSIQNSDNHVVWGDVYGLRYAWRSPLHYHRPTCSQVATILLEQNLEKVPRYGEGVPSSRNRGAFLDYVLLQLDVYTRRLNTRDSKQADAVMAKLISRAHAWRARLNNISTFAVGHMKIAEYLNDPSGWIEKENKRLAENGHEFRYRKP